MCRDVTEIERRSSRSKQVEVKAMTSASEAIAFTYRATWTRRANASGALSQGLMVAVITGVLSYKIGSPLGDLLRDLALVSILGYEISGAPSATRDWSEYPLWPLRSSEIMNARMRFGLSIGWMYFLGMLAGMMIALWNAPAIKVESLFGDFVQAVDVTCLAISTGAYVARRPVARKALIRVGLLAFGAWAARHAITNALGLYPEKWSSLLLAIIGSAGALVLSAAFFAMGSRSRELVSVAQRGRRRVVTPHIGRWGWRGGNWASAVFEEKIGIVSAAVVFTLTSAAEFVAAGRATSPVARAAGASPAGIALHAPMLLAVGSAGVACYASAMVLSRRLVPLLGTASSRSECAALSLMPFSFGQMVLAMSVAVALMEVAVALLSAIVWGAVDGGTVAVAAFAGTWGWILSAPYVYFASVVRARAAGVLSFRSMAMVALLTPLEIVLLSVSTAGYLAGGLVGIAIAGSIVGGLAGVIGASLGRRMLERFVEDGLVSR